MGEATGLYKLRCSLLGHTSDVRGVATGRSEGDKEFIISGSRDLSTKVWISSDHDNSFIQFQSCEGHTKFVNCVHTIPPNDKHPTGLILSGGHDFTILAFELGKQQPIFRLVGHKGNVCSIGGTGDSLIVSGSWDLTAKVWREQECIATLEGHTAAVWAVTTIPGNVGEHRILTGSADKEIRLWVNFRPAVTYKGHTDCVRALAVMSSDRFLSASNDATIRLWALSTGESLQVLYGHTNFIYSIALLPNGTGFASVGEDRTLRIWKNFETVQVLFHPATSVWTVAALSNGDIVTGCSDGTLRVFTNDPARMGSLDQLTAFEEEVATSVVAAQQDLGGMKISELPGQDSLMVEGRTDGETKMVREGDKVGCYSWSAAEMKWNKVGDVVGASGATQNTSGKVLHEGKEYDYVFSVDLEANKTLKLPYNVTEDPWFAAQKFIHKNELSQMFLDQVANFIITNTKGMQLGQVVGNNEYVDPFTGDDRYVPGTRGNDYPSGSGGANYTCPLVGSKIGTEREIEDLIKDFLLRQSAEEMGVTSCLLIHSCNKPQDKVANCVGTLSRYLDNIIGNPGEEKYRKIRCSNKVFQEKVAHVLGAEHFLRAVGFQKALLKADPAALQEEEFWVYKGEDVARLVELRDLLRNTDPIKPEISRN